MRTLWVCTLLFLPSVVLADGLSLSDLRAEMKRSAEGSWIVVDGAATGAPDKTTVQGTVGFKGSTGVQVYAPVQNGRFQLELGAAGKKLLPGTYEIRLRIDPRVQRKEVFSLLKGKPPVTGKVSLVVGTPEEEAAEREKIKAKYETYLELLNGIFGGVGMWGGSLTSQSGIEKLSGKGKVSRKVQARILREWRTYGTEFDRTIPVIRHDLKAFSEYVVVSYYPEVDQLINELMVTLERWHDTFTLMICKNLGVDPPKGLAERVKHKAGELQKKFPFLAGRCYSLLGIQGDSWKLIMAGNPERIEDAQGDLFLSTVAKFKINKPGSDWYFDVGQTNPALRIRIRHRNKEITNLVVSGVELRNYPLSNSMRELARLEENGTRSRYPGFELIKSKRINPPDLTMPKKVRPGQEMRFWVKAGEARYYVLQYSLFCRWHKRTYNSMAFIAEPAVEQWLPVVEGINKTFMVLDEPDDARKKKLIASIKSANSESSHQDPEPTEAEGNTEKKKE